MNNKNKFTKDMTFTGKLGIAIGTGIGSIAGKCLSKYDEIVIDNMRRDGYTDEEIAYYFKTGKTYAQAREEEQRYKQARKETIEQQKKGGLINRLLYGKKKEPKRDKDGNIKMNNGNDYGFSYSINYE